MSSSENSPRFTIERAFNAPREKVFQAWSNAGQLEQWWGPKGMATKVKKLEFQPGGKLHYHMQGGGNEMWGIFRYIEMQAPERIVYVNSFSNEQGEIAKAPFPFDWPREVHNNLTFREENGKTILRLEASPINPSEEQAASFRKLNESMQKGFGGTFDQLDQFLAK